MDRNGAETRCSLLTEIEQARSTRAFAYVKQSTTVDSPIEDALEVASGSLPGFRPHHDRAGAQSAHSVPLRERLSVPRRRPSRSFRRRRDARLGGSAVAGFGLGRL